MISCPNDAEYEWIDMIILIDGKSYRISELKEDNPYISKRFWKWEDGDYAYHDPDGPVEGAVYPFDSEGILEPFEAYWIKAKSEKVVLRFPVDAQIEPNAIPLRSTSAVRRSALVETPPAPLGGAEKRTPSNSYQEDAGGGGCFISSVLPSRRD
jgi:hypothetical protein